MNRNLKTNSVIDQAQSNFMDGTNPNDHTNDNLIKNDISD